MKKGLDYDWIRNEMPVYPDDVWIVTPAKCGTTWMQEIAWLIHTNVDLKQAQSHQFYRVPFMELGYVRPNFTGATKPNFETDEKDEENLEGFMSHSFSYVLNMQRPRFIKTHLPLEVLPKNLLQKAKVGISQLFTRTRILRRATKLLLGPLSVARGQKAMRSPNDKKLKMPSLSLQAQNI